MADLLIKTNMKYNINELLFVKLLQRWGHDKKGEVHISQIHNINEVEEGRRRVELVECVRSGDKEDELEKHATSYTCRWKRGSGLFSVKLVTITNEFTIEVTS